MGSLQPRLDCADCGVSIPATGYAGDVWTDAHMHRRQCHADTEILFYPVYILGAARPYLCRPQPLTPRQAMQLAAIDALIDALSRRVEVGDLARMVRRRFREIREDDGK